MEELDAFDQRILSLLQVNSRRTGEALSAEIGLSPAACLRRVQRLRRIWAIEKEVAVIAPSYRARGTTIVVILRIDRQNPKLMDDFCHRLRRVEDVERLIWVTGDDDIMLVMNCASMDSFGDFCQAYLDDSPVVGYKTLVSMREYETGSAIAP